MSMNREQSRVLSNRELGRKANKCLYEGVIIPIMLYGAETWGSELVLRQEE